MLITVSSLSLVFCFLQVQSVHLIVSADPVLVPKMNKYKKVYKNETTGKMETTYQCEKCTKQCRTALALYSKYFSIYSTNNTSMLFLEVNVLAQFTHKKRLIREE